MALALDEIRSAAERLDGHYGSESSYFA